MDYISQELSIPRKQICETTTKNRFKCIAHKSYLKNLVKNGKISNFAIYPNVIDEWPKQKNLLSSWMQVYVVACKKLSQKVIPLPKQKTDINENELPLTYSQLLHYIQQTNYKNLWKSAHKKFVNAVDESNDLKPSSSSSKILENITSNLVPYDVLMREAIVRLYNCPIIHFQLDKVRSDSLSDDSTAANHQDDTMNVNHYPFLAAVESNTHFYLFYCPLIENTLLDCINYSPAILDKSHNKPLFLIYQLLNLLKSIHEKGLLMGDVTLNDIYLTENLLIQVIPKIDSNMIEYEEPSNANNNLIEQNSEIVTFLTSPTYTLKDYCELWCTGKISNFDYLTILNNFAGRRIDSADYHHIVPWVIDFTSKNGNWRDLTKTKYRLTKGDAQLDITYQHIKQLGSAESTTPHHVSDVLSEITFYVYMARKTPKSVLCRHVRSKFVAHEYPASIKRLQEWTPDECIPEFFNDPSVFKSIHEDLSDLEIPVWSSCPEDFIAKHREALESQYVSENLHHWIDLTFGYKLSGKAAVKAKNVVLSLVDEHQTLCQRGVVQLFTSHHPPKQFKNLWYSKMPPRINPSELRKRLTRSTEDLSMENYVVNEILSTTPPPPSRSPRSSSRLPHQSESIERSPSYHIGPRSNQNMIQLPPNYNPIHQVKSSENMGNFLSKTFYEITSKVKPQQTSSEYPLTQSFQSFLVEKESENSFTNKMFLETYERSLKDSKMYQNIKQRKQQLMNSKKHFKQIMQESKSKDLKILGCLIVEIFMNRKLRSLTSSNSSFDERFGACVKLIKHEENLLPGCVSYAVKLLFGLHGDDNTQITDLGLPDPNAQQLLQPILSNLLIPFPDHYYRIYAAIKSLKSFDVSMQMLDLFTFYDCDGKNCEKYEEQDKTRVSIQRKIAECQVKAFTALTEGLLDPTGFDQFDGVELLLPFIIDMFNSEETGILAAWFLFDTISTAIGVEKSRKYLLTPILRLYDVHNDEKVNFLNTNLESSFKVTASTFRSKKAVKLYHHSFLIKLIIRLGLKCFLENFTSILIEAAGGSKDTEIESPFHLHDSVHMNDMMTSNDVTINEKSNDESPTLVSPANSNDDDDDDDDKTMSAKVVMDEMFEFDNDEAQQAETENAIAKLIENFDIHSETSSIDLKMNHSEADEAQEHEIEESMMSPTIPIPKIFKRAIAVASIGCEIGSRKSVDSFDILSKTPLERDDSVKSSSRSESVSLRRRSHSKSVTRPSRSTRISEMAAESLIWLAHRLGPVLTARYITRNLLKMLTLCYVSQENLLPSTNNEKESENLAFFTITDGYVVGDENAQKVLDCLTSISALFGEHFILYQYLPHVSELVSLSKKKVTANLEGGLISCVQLMKFIIPCLSDATIMEQLQEVFLKNIIKPIIRLLNSTHYTMPSGFLGRSVLARKLVDLLYILTIRIGTEISIEHLCDPHLQRFFLIFDKAYGVGELEDDNANNDEIREKGLDEIRETFTPSLAHSTYLPFAKQLGESAMRKTVKNLELILNLSHEHETPACYKSEKTSIKLQPSSKLTADFVDSPSSFGTNVSIVGNRLDFQITDGGPISEQTNLIDLVAYKLKNVSSNRQLKGNWQAYWINEIGRAEKDQNFNLKQIRLQTFAGHTNSIRGILCLDNENSFMSASKDRTVKLWSLRNEGDGSKISPCQFTYTGHKKSVHSLAFLESMRLAVSCDGGVHLWDPFVGSLVSQIDGQRYTPVSIVRSYPTPSSLILAGTADTTVKAMDSRICDYVLEWKLTTTPSGSVRCMTVAPSAKWVALGLPGGQITLIDGRTGVILSSWKASDGELLQMQAPNDNEIIASSLDNTLSVWNVHSATRLYDLKTPAEPVHCLRLYGDELIVGTPANRIGSYNLQQHDHPQSYTKLRSEVFSKGVLTTFSLLQLNRLLLAGNDGGNITLLC